MEKSDPDADEKGLRDQSDPGTQKEEVLADLERTIRRIRKNPIGLQEEWPYERKRLTRKLRDAGLDPASEFARAWTS